MRLGLLNPLELKLNVYEADKENFIAYLGLGSNIEPSKNIIIALDKIDSKFILLDISNVFESPSIEGHGPNFLNCVAVINTSLPADNLKNTLRKIEANMGRIRTVDKNAPRTIDIDILIYSDQVLDEEVWTLPHLAIPLVEVFPTLVDSKTGRHLQEIAVDLNRKFNIIKREDLVGIIKWQQIRNA